jgi:hypothetical protein
MPSESGDLKLKGNFRKLIDLISADADYKPSNASPTPSALVYERYRSLLVGRARA